MSAISLLEVPKWNEDKFKADFKKPELVDYFTFSVDSKFYKDINLLKYFDSDAKLNVPPIKLKFDNDVGKNIPVKGQAYLPVTQWMNENTSDYFGDVEIVTFPSVLSIIMNTPYEINGDKRKWTLKATFENNKIYLIFDEDKKSNVTTYTCENYGYKITRPCNCNKYRRRDSSECKNYKVPTPVVSKLLKHYELLKRYLFLRKPENLYRRIISKWEILFMEIYKLNIGENKVLYLSETPGVLNERRVNSFEELKTAEHIYCDVSELADFTQDVVNYNPIWWSRAQLINAKQYFIGIYNDRTKDLQEIKNFKMDKFNDIKKYENLWSPNSAWNFLNDVLTFIKHEVYKIDPQNRSSYSWQFKSFENDRPFITMYCSGPDGKLLEYPLEMSDEELDDEESLEVED